MKLKIRGRMRMPMVRRTLARALAAALAASCVAALACSCSSGADQEMRGDVAPRQLSSNKLTPEQCMAGGEVQQAAVRTGDEGYVIQRGDVLSVDFYLNPEFNDEPTV